jgi:hypothetical protein
VAQLHDEERRAEADDPGVPTTRRRRDDLRAGVAALASTILVIGCTSAPAGPAGGPAGGQAGGGGALAGGTRPSAAASTASTTASSYPDHFTGTIAGSNGVDAWDGTAKLDRVPDADECNQGGAMVCYRIAGGSVVWTVSGVSKTIQLDGSTAADGIVLIVSDASHPDHNGTYEISVAPSTEVFTTVKGEKRYAFETVRDWVDVIDFPRYDTTTWHLAGQSGTGGGCGIDGCGAGQSWTWDLQGTFGP